MLVESSCRKDQQVVIKNLWAGSQSYKRGCLCGANPRNEEFVESKLACGHASKLLEIVIDLGLNLIVKTLILYSGFVLPWG